MPRKYTKEFTVYKYNELSEDSKEKVKQWLLDDDLRNELLHEDITEDLKYLFPKSELKVHYSLEYCQGDGLNVEGKLSLYDIINKLKYTDKEKRTLKFYFDNSENSYTFESNRRDGYSCKFIDRKFIGDAANESVEELQSRAFKNINKSLLTNFYDDMLDYFEKYESKWEDIGYKYLYEISDEEAEEECNANDYEFFADGRCDW